MDASAGQTASIYYGRKVHKTVYCIFSIFLFSLALLLMLRLNSPMVFQALHTRHRLLVQRQIQNVPTADWFPLSRREQEPTQTQLLTIITLLSIRLTLPKHNHKLQLRSATHISPLNSSKVLNILRRMAMLRTRFRDIRPSSNKRSNLRSSSNNNSMLSRNNTRNIWPILPPVAIGDWCTRIRMGNWHREERALNSPIIHPEQILRRRSCPQVRRLIRM